MRFYPNKRIWVKHNKRIGRCCDKALHFAVRYSKRGYATSPAEEAWWALYYRLGTLQLNQAPARVIGQALRTVEKALKPFRNVTPQP